MKLTKKLMAFALVIAIMFSMAVTVFANGNPSTETDDTTKHDITITGAINGATYSGYRLLNATTSLKPEGCSHGSDAAPEAHISSCYNVAYEVNPAYLNILQTVINNPNATNAEIIDYIKNRTTAEAIQDFAHDVYAVISSRGTSYDAAVTATEGSAVFADVQQGYWLISESLTEGHEVSHSLVLLDTAGSRDLTVATKREDPTLTKFVLDNSTNYGSTADVQIGDEVEFLIIADVPNPIGYENYKYVIHDQMDEGLTLVENSGKITLNTVNGTTLASGEGGYYDVYYDDQYSDCSNCSLHIVVDVENATDDGTLKADDRLYITYKAILNENAKIFDNTGFDSANKNSAYLEYSNNPFNSQETSNSTTSIVYVSTFPLKLTKVDNANNKLTGAKFVLSTKKDLTITGADSDGVPDNTSHLIPMTKTEKDTKTTYRVVPQGYADSNPESVVYVIEAGEVDLVGFNDQIEYYLYEIVAPDGYNKLNAPASFKFFATYNNNNDTPAFADGYPKLSVNTATETSVLEANIVNNTGAELPSTGGIGTTIFYIAGGLLVVAAIVLLITRKRMSTES